jgi:3-oxoacyl-(acyl-carrier-protein) synthase/acyl carrier protein
MMTDNLTRLDILEMIKNHQLTSKEGLQLLKGLKHDNSNDGGFKKEELRGLDESSINAATTSNVQQSQAIAIIGMSGKFPDANDVNEFWDNLMAGKDSVREIPETRWSIGEFYDSDAQVPQKSYSKRGGFLSDIELFDPLFFKISPREAQLMDPQQRLFLQEAWRALEDAGYSPLAVEKKKCGVFVGCSGGDYQDNLRESQAQHESYSFMGNAVSILAARISYVLNLRGPNIAVDTACSSSLVAIYLACESIRSGTSELALAGGVAISTTQEFYIGLSEIDMLSPDGKCYTFDHRANGLVPGEGVGVVVLKSLAAAKNDGNPIYGVIKGSGINQDGKTNGITAPSAPSQTALECEVYNQYHIHPDTISYVEAHGTGTQLGDPIEVHALTDAFRKYTGKTQYCAIGSVKTNIGHTLASAGVAGLIKLLLCLKHKKLVPSLHLEKENEHINFKDSPFYVNTGLKEWKTEQGIPRRAAINSFGFSGTNAHLVIEEYEMPPSFFSGQAYQIIVLSAKNEARLQAYAKKIINFLNPVLATEMAFDTGAVNDEAELCQQIQQDLLKVASEILKVRDNEINLDEAFSDYGFDTVSLTELSHQLNDKYFVSITPALLYEQVSLEAVAQYLYDQSQDQTSLKENTFNRQANLSLADMSYTLQVGREAMTERLAMVVSSLDEVRDKLTQYIQGQTKIENCYRGNVKTSKVQAQLLIEGEEGRDFIKSIIKNKKLTKLAQMWVFGIDIDWHLLYPDQKPRRISLPTYPFAKERYWVPVSEPNLQVVDKQEKIAKRQPLVGSNMPTPVKKYHQEATVPQPTVTIPLQPPADEGQVLAKLQQDLLTMASTISKVSVNEIDLSEDIGEYGFDSISFTEFANQISDKYQLDITRAILFEYPSVGAFSEFLCQEYQAHLLDYYIDSLKAVSPPPETAEVADVEGDKLKILLEKLQQDLLSMASTISKVSVNNIDLSEDIGEYGFDSISFTEFANQISDKYRLDITRALLFKYPSVGACSEFLCQEYQAHLLDYYT